MKSNWLLPLKLGVVTGVLVGFVASLRIILSTQRYIGYHLYNTSARTMAVNIDICVPLTVVLFYLVAVILSMIAGRKAGGKSTHIAGLMLFISASVFGTLFVGHSALASDGVMLGGIGQDMGFRLLCCVLCLAAGLLALRWLRHHPICISAAFVRAMVSRDGKAAKIMLALFVPCVVICLAINIAAGALSVLAAASVRQKPNVVFIMVDTLRADHLGCYGYPINTSPNIDRLAKESIRFGRTISQAPFTAWSVPSFMTSQYPQDIGSLQNDPESHFGLDDRYLTLAEVLKDSGYATSAVIGNSTITKSRGMGQGFDSYDDSPGAKDVNSPLIADAAKEQIARLKDHKFFLFLLFMDPHSPYTVHDQYDFSSRYKGESQKEIQVSMNERAERYSRKDLRRMQTYYDSEIRFTDESIGVFMNELKKSGLYDNTLIIFMADHGEEFGEHGWMFHGHTLYDQVLNVPLLMKLPGQHRGTLIDRTVALLDVFPTILRHLGNEYSKLGLQGIAHELGQPGDVRDRFVFSANTSESRSAVDSRYKYTFDLGTQAEELYNIVRDPTEKTNIARNEPAVCSAIRRVVMSREEASKKITASGGSPSKASELTEQEKSRLKALGYLAN